MNGIYMDNAATTAVKPEVIQAMAEVMAGTFGNPSSVHGYGREARKLVEAARQHVAEAINAQPSEIYFTSGGTEADNWALRGCITADKRHIVTSAIEHHAILHTAEQLEKEGCTVTILPVDELGRVSPADVRRAIRPDTAVVSVMFANNEIGTLQPVGEIGAICRELRVPFHTDAVQAMAAVPIDVQQQNIDLMSVSAHKFHGPKGIGALYIRQGIRAHNFLQGGAQERGRRPGTENVPGIVGMGKAVELAMADFVPRNERVRALRDRLIQGLLQIPYSRLNGDPVQRLPGNVNVGFEFIEGESLLISLDLKGIAASTGSACASGSLDPSHVLLAIGQPHEIAHGSLRLSLSDQNTAEEVDQVIRELKPIVERLRAMSPLYAEIEGGVKLV